MQFSVSLLRVYVPDHDGTVVRGPYAGNALPRIIDIVVERLLDLGIDSVRDKDGHHRRNCGGKH